MSKTVVQAQVRAVLPTKEGCAVFLGNKEKVFIIYVDTNVGAAITMFMRGTPKERPLTHDLMANIMMALGAKVERVIINELQVTRPTFARLIISAENELQQRKIIEIDSRPSDCIAMAIQQKADYFRQPRRLGRGRGHERRAQERWRKAASRSKSDPATPSHHATENCPTRENPLSFLRLSQPGRQRLGRG